MNWVLLKNSLLVSGSATLLALSFGFFAALWVMGLPANIRKLFLGGAIVAFALPPFVVTNCWMYLLGQTGIWRSWLPWNILSIPGAAWILGLMLWPVTLVAVLGAWQRLQPQWLESDLAVRGRHLVGGLLLPLARGALTQAAVVTFVLALNNFAVPALLQVKVYPAEMWIQFSTNLKTGPALLLSWPMLAAPLLLLIWLTRRGVRWPHLQNSVSPRLFRLQLGSGWGLASAAVACFLFVLSAALPLLQLLTAGRAWAELPGALAAGQSALWGSLALALSSASLVLLIGLLPLTRPGRGAGPGYQRLRTALACLRWAPFLIPGVLLGIALITLFNRSWLTALYTSAGMVVLAYALRYLAPGRAIVAEARRRVDPLLLDTARLEGADSWQMLRHVEWPQIAPQAAVAWYVVFVLCLWDVESMILITPPGLETLALRIFNLLHYGHNSQVDALCLLLLAVALAPFCCWAVGTWARSLSRQRQLPRRDRLGSGRGLKTAGLAGMIPAVAVLLVCLGCTRSEPSSAAALNSRIFESIRIIGTRGAGVGQLNKPRSLALDRQDNLYVVDMTGRVQKFSSNGVWLASWQMPETDLGKAKGMCRDEAGNIVVVEPHYARVNHFSPAGKLVLQWGQHGTNHGQLSVPRAVAMNARDEIFITEYQQAERVQKFVWDHAAQKSGAAPQWVLSFGKAGPGPGEFNRPEGMCVDAENRVYVADSCNHRIQVFSSDGKLLRAYGKPGRGPGELSYPYDICVDAAGRQYVCEFGNSRIQVFGADGQVLEIIGGPGAEPGRFSNPWGVALDSEGNLYVADSQNHRVQKLMRRRQNS
jgi:ABC-type Fe3+ transport system permease subunit/sugar lactone lactonase YvrE